MSSNRRQFLGSMAGLAGVTALSKPTSLFATHPFPGKEKIASNVYSWFTFFLRDERNFYGDLDAGLAEFAQSGVTGFEPSVSAPDQIDDLVPLLDKHGLWMSSVYVGTSLHEDEKAEASITEVLAIAEATKNAGVTIIVTNPSPLGWGDSESKTDSQLETQARYLDQLGAELRKRDLTLAYHNHDPEMRHSAREFHHMMLATDPNNVKLCLEPHWIYRGAGNSQVALFDIVKHYGHRTVEIHIRQSVDEIWSEAFGKGDIDYPHLVGMLAKMEVKPLLVLEQCIEEESAHTMDAIEAHRIGLSNAAEVFAPLM